MPFGYKSDARESRKRGGVQARRDPESDQLNRAAARNSIRRKEPGSFW